MGDQGMEMVKEPLLKVDVERTEASSRKDKHRVLGLIENGIGFRHVNNAVRVNLIKWISIVVRMHFQDICWKGELSYKASHRTALVVDATVPGLSERTIRGNTSPPRNKNPICLIRPRPSLP